MSADPSKFRIVIDKVTERSFKYVVTRFNKEFGTDYIIEKAAPSMLDPAFGEETNPPVADASHIPQEDNVPFVWGVHDPDKAAPGLCGPVRIAAQETPPVVVQPLPMDDVSLSELWVLMDGEKEVNQSSDIKKVAEFWNENVIQGWPKEQSISEKRILL
jgi:hypothetical protein